MAELLAGADLDAEVWRVVFSREVLGLAWCHYDPTLGELAICATCGALEASACPGAGEQRPVVLRVRGCAVRHARSRRSIHGHNAFCLDPAPEFSETWEGLGLVVERMRELGHDRFRLDRGLESYPSDWSASFWRFSGNRDAAATAPEAVARAAVRAVLEAAP